MTIIIAIWQLLTVADYINDPTNFMYVHVHKVTLYNWFYNFNRF